MHKDNIKNISCELRLQGRRICAMYDLTKLQRSSMTLGDCPESYTRRKEPGPANAERMDQLRAKYGGLTNGVAYIFTRASAWSSAAQVSLDRKQFPAVRQAARVVAKLYFQPGPDTPSYFCFSCTLPTIASSYQRVPRGTLPGIAARRLFLHRQVPGWVKKTQQIREEPTEAGPIGSGKRFVETSRVM